MNRFKSNESGYVVLWAMVVMVFLAMVMMGELKIFLLDRKMQQAQRDKILWEDHLEIAASKIVQDVDMHSSCVRDALNDRVFKQFLRGHQVCHWQEGTWSLQYLVEYLGVDPCLVSAGSKENQAMEHWLIVLTGRPNHAPAIFPEAALALHMAKIKGKLQKKCPQKRLRFIQHEIMSWRRFAL